jgi:PTH2 family peptidyl-tRNA hydrolase
MSGNGGDLSLWNDYVKYFVMFGLGAVSGALMYSKFCSRRMGSQIDTFSKAARLTALRAKGLGRNHKMVFVVRSDLGMGKGKIAAQCSHATLMCYQSAQILDPENLELWEATGQAKICLKIEGGESELKTLQKNAKAQGLVTAVVCDAGHTQVAPGTSTVLGIGPAPVAIIDRVTSHLKLL